MTMVERVARALWQERSQRRMHGTSRPYHFAREHWDSLARAALTAMREPSADMGLAMLDQLEPGSMPRSMPVCRMFTAAINAALTEGEG